MHDLNEDLRCTFTYADGRRCRMLRPPEHASLCVHHARQEARHEDRLPPEPPSLVTAGALDNPWAIRRSLKRLFAEAVAGRLSPANAEAAAHIGGLLLIRTRREVRQRRASRKSRAAKGQP